MAFFEQLFKVPPLKKGEVVKYGFFRRKEKGKPVARVGTGRVVSQPWGGIFVELKPIQPQIPLEYLSEDGTFTAPRGSVFLLPQKGRRVQRFLKERVSVADIL